MLIDADFALAQPRCCNFQYFVRERLVIDATSQDQRPDQPGNRGNCFLAPHLFGSSSVYFRQDRDLSPKAVCERATYGLILTHRVWSKRGEKATVRKIVTVLG